MIQLIPMPMEHVIGIRVSGKMEKADIVKMTRAMEEKLAIYKKINIYVEVESLHGISLDALMADIKFILPHFRDFDKKAVVSQKHWIEQMVAIGDKWFPRAEIRHFSFDQKDDALRWIQSS